MLAKRFVPAKNRNGILRLKTLLKKVATCQKQVRFEAPHPL